MRWHFQRGHVCGGRTPFGYDDVEVAGHVERRINEAEAVVVRQLFALYANGVGLKRLAQTLNHDGAPAPGRRWTDSSVREALTRTWYRGVGVYGQTQKVRDEDGNARMVPRPAAEHQHLVLPALRIVSEDLWAAVQHRLERQRPSASGRQGYRDFASRYLLTQFGQVTCCGGAFSVITRDHRGPQRVRFMGCWAAHHGRPCANTLLVPMARVDAAVLQALGGDVLRPAVVTAIIDRVFAALVPATLETTMAALRSQRHHLDAKIAHLTDALEQGAGSLPSVIAKLAERQAERDDLTAQLTEAETLQHVQVDRASIEAQVQADVANWRALLTGSVEDGRTLLRQVLAGPVQFTPDGDGYSFEAPTAIGSLIGRACRPSGLASPAGVEPASPP
jgi:site-specific DNA recombinase